MGFNGNVIIRYSPGFANSLMEFCAGYAMMKKLKGGVIIGDLGLCQNSGFGYIVDEFNIPDYSKVSYYLRDVNQIGLQSIESIPDNLKKDTVLIDKTVYSELDDVRKFVDEGHNLYLSDFFLSFPLYYGEYWDEIRTMLTPRVPSANVEAFKKLISDKISVGVHFRRTDMLYADFAISTSDDFYKAAIAYLRRRIGKRVLFCIFSDDIEYTKSLLGDSSDLRYIHFLGYDDADMEEFVCLSLCDHRILSTSSTFGEMADLINWNAKRITMYQGKAESTYWTHFKKGLCRIIMQARFSFLKVFFRNHFIHTKIDDAYRKNRFYFDHHDIKKYISKFETEKSDRCVNTDYLDQGYEIVNSKDAEALLKKICEIELDYYRIERKKEIFVRLRKFDALYIMENYEKALILGDSIWGWAIWNSEFKIKYADTLSRCGMKRESMLISREFKRPIKFIVFPEVESEYSSSLSGIGEVAVGLAKMGIDVSIVEMPKNDTESIYINENDYLTNRHGVRLGCRQYHLNEDIIESRSEFIINQRNEFLAKCPGGGVFVLSRDKYIAEERVSGVVYIFADYRDKSDSEKKACEQRYGVCDRFSSDDYDRVDYILTCDKNHYASLCKDKKKLIVYNEETNQYPYWTCEERWKLIYNHRMSDRAMSICESLADSIIF